MSPPPLGRAAALTTALSRTRRRREMIVSAAFAAAAASRSRCFVTTVSPALKETGGENSTTGIPIVRFKVALDGQRYDVSSPVNEKLSTVLAKHRVLVSATPIISPVLGHDAHVIVPNDVATRLGELTDAERDKIEELCVNPIFSADDDGKNGGGGGGSPSRLASQVPVHESFEGKTFAMKGLNRIMRT